MLPEQESGLLEKLRGNLIQDAVLNPRHDASHRGHARTMSGVDDGCSIVDGFRSSLTPSMAYGRHRGPAGLSARRAAVMIGIYQKQLGEKLEWVIPLTLRPRFMVHHAGQICLPGGRLERGETPSQAATREYTEELGQKPDIRFWAGRLNTQYVFGSNHLVTPFVALLEPPAEPFRPDPREVESAMEFPISLLWQTEARTLVTRTKRFFTAGGDGVGTPSEADLPNNLDGLEKTGNGVPDPDGPVSAEGVGRFFRATIPAIRFQGHLVWGATAMILDELAHRLHPRETQAGETSILPN